MNRAIASALLAVTLTLGCSGVTIAVPVEDADVPQSAVEQYKRSH